MFNQQFWLDTYLPIYWLFQPICFYSVFVKGFWKRNNHRLLFLVFDDTVSDFITEMTSHIGEGCLYCTVAYIKTGRFLEK